MLNFNMFNSANPIVNKDGTPTRFFIAFCREIWNNLGGGKELSLEQQVDANVEDLADETAARRQADQALQNIIDGYGDIVTHNADEFVAFPEQLPADIARPTGGTVQDEEARAAINKIITVLEQYRMTGD